MTGKQTQKLVEKKMAAFMRYANALAKYVKASKAAGRTPQQLRDDLRFMKQR